MLRVFYAEFLKSVLNHVRYVIPTIIWTVSPFLALLPFIFQANALSSNYSSNFFEVYSGTSNVISFLIVGDVIATYTSIILFRTTIELQMERHVGTFELLFIAPSGATIIYFGKVIAHTVIAVVLTLPIFLYARWLFGVKFNLLQIATVYFVLFIATPSLIGLSFLVGGCVFRYKSVHGALSIADNLIWLFSPVRYPVEISKITLFISLFIPVTYALVLARSLTISKFSPRWEFFLILILLDVLLFWLGFKYMRSGEKIVRQKGMAAVY